MRFPFGLLVAALFGLPIGTKAGPAEKSPGPVALALPASPTAEDIFRVRAFEEPLVPIGGEPTAAENAALAAALNGYANRNGPDDFSSLTQFLEEHPASAWAASLLTGLGSEYYNTAHYSLALESWARGWSLAKNATNAMGKAVGDRAAGELAYMYARLGRMTELDALLSSLQGRLFAGPATEKITGAREGLWMMKNRPEVSFRCGPLALHRIKLKLDPQHPRTEIIQASASTRKGFSLSQVAELSDEVGLHYQMAFREQQGAFVIPSVVHWKVGHYAALVRQEGERFLLEDPTFGNTVWTTRQALEQETSGYFLIPSGPLTPGWRKVETREGDTVWGKGQTSNNDSRPITPRDAKKGPPGCSGMTVPTAHLMTANLSLADSPLGYVPPVGPAIDFTVRYNHRDAFQPSIFRYFNEGDKWTTDWLSYITDKPQSPLADLDCYMGGGGVRTFTGFDTNTQTFNYEQYDQTRLTRTGPASYEMLWPDGSKFIFDQSDGSIGSSRNIFLTRVADPQGNAVTLTYDTNLLLVAITDAIGQVTTLTYGLPAGTVDGVAMPADPYKLTRVTDPFGRFATFEYWPVQIGSTYVIVNGHIVDGDPIYVWGLKKITDVLGLSSQFTYVTSELLLESNNEVIYRTFINSLVTPYGRTTFSQGNNGTTRWLETVYPDAGRDRVEFNQTVNVPESDPQSSVPTGMGGMATQNGFLSYRNTYYWDRNACATAYGDYTKARLYHWLHAPTMSTTSGILESTREPLENRVWYNYPGQTSSLIEGASRLPEHIGRVLDDGSSQVYTYAYNGFGHVTNSVDPIGRTFSLLYDSNGIDLLEARMTRAGKNELLAQATYNNQHQPLTRADASGKTNRFTYNARGQLLTATNPKDETTTFNYDINGYLLSVDGPLPGTADTITFTYDAFGRPRTITDVSGYTRVFDYDVMNRLTRITHPDGTFTQYAYDRLDLSSIRDRAGRMTYLDHDAMRQLRKKTDPLNRSILLQWCSCGALKSLTDPLGRTTSWFRDVQGRRIGKHYGDGSQVNYTYEKTTSRVRQIVDEKLQTTTFNYNLDNTLSSIAYANSAVPTPHVAFTYDPDYERVDSITNGSGTTLYSYVPVTATPSQGAGKLAVVDGPLPGDTITYQYDELGRAVSESISGVGSSVAYDALGRVTSLTNALGAFGFAYDGSSSRLASESFPNGLLRTATYGGNLEDFSLQQISYTASALPISRFSYGHDIARGRITTWSQQAGPQPSSVFNFTYDDADQLLFATVTNAGVLVNTFAYGYDAAGNRLLEQSGANTRVATYNALNEITTSTALATTRSNEWGAANRLVSVSAGNQRAEFTYDGQRRLAGIRNLIDGNEISHRLFVWKGGRITQERDGNGVLTKRFFGQGVQILNGTNAGSYYYTRDHLGSIRELIDAAGNVRARYTYDPFGRRTRISGDLDADFGFAGMFWANEVSLYLTRFRAYDPELGRWLSRDPLKNAEAVEGPNLYSYVANNPINRRDPSGLVGGIGTMTPYGAAELRGSQSAAVWEKLVNRAAQQGVDLNRLADQGLAEMSQTPTPQVTQTVDGAGGEIIEVGEGEIQEVGGEIVEVSEGEIQEVGGEIMEVPVLERTSERFAPTRTFPGFAGAFTEFIGAGITILTMTDCNTAEGLFALVRVSKGGLLNKYEDQMMKDLKQSEGW